MLGHGGLSLQYLGQGLCSQGLNITKTDVSVEGIWRLYPQYSTIYSWVM